MYLLIRCALFFLFIFGAFAASDENSLEDALNVGLARKGNTADTVNSTMPMMTATPRMRGNFCSWATITLSAGNHNFGGTITPTSTGIIRNNDNETLTITCTAKEFGRGLASMKFNVNESRPLDSLDEIVSVTLNCVNGQWVYDPGMGQPSRLVTEVNCRHAYAAK